MCLNIKVINVLFKLCLSFIVPCNHNLITWCMSRYCYLCINLLKCLFTVYIVIVPKPHTLLHKSSEKVFLETKEFELSTLIFRLSRKLNIFKNVQFVNIISQLRYPNVKVNLKKKEINIYIKKKRRIQRDKKNKIPIFVRE